jgi:hypothetical protein
METYAEKRKKWINIIIQCNNSGMKKENWLKQNNISRHNFYRWQSTLRKELGRFWIMDKKLEHIPAIVEEIERPIEKRPFLELKEPIDVGDHNSSVTVKCDSFIIELDESISDEFLSRIIKAVSNA